MDLKIQMLGTGSAFAKVFNNNNALLTVDGLTLLVDCGITAPKALYELGYSFNDLDAILLTHIHADHIGGLEELAFQMKYIFGRKPILFLADTLVETLWEHSLKGGLQQDETETLHDFFDVRPLSVGQPHDLLPGLHVELIATRHIPNKANYSLLFNDFFFYSGDTVFDSDLLNSLVNDRDVRVIFHDCQLHPPGVVHACLSQLLTLPKAIQERVFLMHYGDDQPDFVGRTGPMKFVEQHRIYDVDQLTFAGQFGMIE
ncbi:MBL fold metallo-hydrolase [Cohnella silvisoli]|uniref:MBL fold metallo-hydrolase n=1 Tax=Cohnella silvisoli TaxID=2873699 RepID=A0ABV1KZ34_9BACL|nr:MBL fold metallo-hydrolase [Cohnella silvisoli]MCD9024282.1 MBL fold metallo-hydrolase [Cohnella silvisoli]